MGSATGFQGHRVGCELDGVVVCEATTRWGLNGGATCEKQTRGGVWMEWVRGGSGEERLEKVAGHQSVSLNRYLVVYTNQKWAVCGYVVVLR